MLLSDVEELRPELACIPGYYHAPLTERANLLEEKLTQLKPGVEFNRDQIYGLMSFIRAPEEPVEPYAEAVKPDWTVRGGNPAPTSLMSLLTDGRYVKYVKAATEVAKMYKTAMHDNEVILHIRHLSGIGGFEEAAIVGALYTSPVTAPLVKLVKEKAKELMGEDLTLSYDDMLALHVEAKKLNALYKHRAHVAAKKREERGLTAAQLKQQAEELANDVTIKDVAITLLTGTLDEVKAKVDAGAFGDVGRTTAGLIILNSMRPELFARKRNGMLRFKRASKRKITDAVEHVLSRLNYLATKHGLHTVCAAYGKFMLPAAGTY